MKPPWPDEVLQQPPFQPRRRNIDRSQEICVEVFTTVLAEQRRARWGDRRWLARVGRVTGPEVWEALLARGVVPESWVGNVRRWFRDYDGREWESPPMMGDAAAVAGDPSGVEACEALADDLMRRLAPYGQPAAQRFVWFGSEQHWVDPGVFKQAERALEEAWSGSRPADAPSLGQVEGWVPPWEDKPLRERYVRLLYRDWLHRDARGAGVPLALASESPFAPAIAMHQLGYAFAGVYEGAAQLVFARR